VISFRVLLGRKAPVGETDLELIRRAVRPLANLAPLVFRGAVTKAIEGLTHKDVRDLYAAAGGDSGIQAFAEAIKRIGRGETVGAP
jgi:hypothetical protein